MSSSCCSGQTSGTPAPRLAANGQDGAPAHAAGAKVHLYWFDAHFPRSGLQFIYDEVDFEVLKSVRVLSCARSEVTRATLDDYARFRAEVAPRGASLEWRTLLDREDFTDKHDRWINADGTVWNVPPLTAVMAKKWGTLLRDPSDPPLDDWWARGTPIDAIGGA